MNYEEFLSLMQRHGTLFAPPATEQSIILANNALQRMRAAILPQPIIDFYIKCGGANLGTGYIFGPMEIVRGTKYPIPSILQINMDLAGIYRMHGKTIFGRNDLFWFAFDSFGKYVMLDNLTLNTMRTYDDAYRAMSDCLIAGKI